MVGDAVGTTLRNNRLIDCNAPPKVNGLFDREGGRFRDHGLVHNNAVCNTRIRRTGNPVALLNIDGGSGWVVAANCIADFAKGQGDRISCAAFMKSNSVAGVFERNLVVCHWKLPLDSGVRVGLSFGTQGIDVRFDTSLASIHDNVLDGRIRSRNVGSFRAENNLTSEQCDLLDKITSRCGTSLWYAEPLQGDLRLFSRETFARHRRESVQGLADFCGSTRPSIADVGPIVYGPGEPCFPHHR